MRSREPIVLHCVCFLTQEFSRRPDPSRPALQDPVENGMSYGAESTQGLFHHYFSQVPMAVRAGS